MAILISCNSLCSILTYYQMGNSLFNDSIIDAFCGGSYWTALRANKEREKLKQRIDAIEKRFDMIATIGAMEKRLVTIERINAIEKRLDMIETTLNNIRMSIK